MEIIFAGGAKLKMKKRLLFHLYAGNEWIANEAIRIHLSCIKHYCSIFDDVVIVVAMDDENEHLLPEIKNTIVNVVDVPSLTIKVVKNTPLREAKTFYDEAVNDNYNGLTFFAHSKGASNIANSRYNCSYIIDWILGLYWLSLNFVDEAEQCLLCSTQNMNSPFFGSFACIERDGNLFERAAYSGAFYWVNMGYVKNEMSINGFDFPVMSTRMFAEEFPGHICVMMNIYQGSHKGSRQFYDVFDMYGEKGEGYYSVFNAIEFHCLHNENLIQDYLNFKSEILLDAESFVNNC